MTLFSEGGHLPSPAQLPLSLYTFHASNQRVIDLPVPKPTSPSDEESVLSFVPAGIGRSIVEYIVASIPGLLLLLIFFAAAEGAMILIKDDVLAVVFLPVVCIMPLLSGAVSTLVLEKLRNKQLTIQRGATVGAAAGLFGSFFSAIILAIVQLAMNQSPFGGIVSGLLVYVALLAIIGIDTVLGALGGALVVKFIKPAMEQFHH